MNEALRYAIDHGILDWSHIEEQVNMEKRKELLNNYQYQIWQGSDGRWRSYIPDQETGKRKMICKSSRRKVEDAVIEFLRADMENPTLKEVFDEWNDHRLSLEKISKATHNRNRQIYRRHFGDFGKRRIKEIDADEIRDFLEEQIPKHHLGSKAFSNLKGIVRGMLKRSKRRKLITFPIEEVSDELDVSRDDFAKVIKEDYEEVYDEEETTTMMKYCVEHQDGLNLCILLIFLTGIRVGEAVTLKCSDFSDISFNIRRTETRYRENGKMVYEVKEFPKTHASVRTVVVPEDYGWIIGRLKQLNLRGGFIFAKADGSHIPCYRVANRLRKNCKRLGIYRKSPHKIRKTYGSMLLDNHIDQKVIEGQMGHTSILCTELHYHRNRRKVVEKQNIISKIPEFQAQQLV